MSLLVYNLMRTVLAARAAERAAGPIPGAALAQGAAAMSKTRYGLRYYALVGGLRLHQPGSLCARRAARCSSPSRAPAR